MVRLASYSHAALLGPGFPLPLDRPFTTSQAEQAGISRTVLARLHRTGLVRRLLRRVYVAAQIEDTLLLRAAALRLVVPDHAVVTDWTAAWVHAGLLPPNAHLEVPPVSVFRPPGGGRLRNDLCVSGERRLLREDVEVVSGLVVTTPLRTALDLGRLARRDQAIGALDALLRLGCFDLDRLVDSTGRFAGERGVVQLRELAPLADGRAESPGESVLRLRWLDQPHLPRPLPQRPVHDELGREVFWLDLGVTELRFAVEYDGEEFHTSDADRAKDAARRRWITLERGWIVVPVTKANLHGSTRDIEEVLTTGVDAARRRLGLTRPRAVAPTRPGPDVR